MRQGKELVESDRVEMRQADGMASLSLHGITADDSGKYIVMAENTFGMDCHYASLAVEGMRPPPLQKKNSSNIRLYIVCGRPWVAGTNNKKIMLTHVRNIFLLFEKLFCLLCCIISKTEFHFVFRYICVFFVNFCCCLGPPDPGGKPTICEVKADSLTLTWYGSVYDGGSVITGYLVEICETGQSWRVLTSE
jgi:hypothetical protein